MRLRVTIGMLMALLVLMMNFPVPTVYAKTWYSEQGGEASVTIEAGGPETIAQYTWHTLKLGVKSSVWASATAEGSMYVYGTASATGWVVGFIEWYQKGNLAVGGIGDFSSWIQVKFQAIDVTAGGALVEKVVLDEHGPWPDYGTTRWDYMDIYLVQSHTYKFVLYVEVHAHAFGVGSAIADFGSIWWEDSQIEWRSIEVPNISEGGGDPCPILYVYDGENYVEEGLLDIHNPEKFDVMHRRMLITDPEPVSNKVLLRLVEHPLTHSYIDNVQLFVIDENDYITELPLVLAFHSEYGNVKAELMYSDDVRTDTDGNETIDLAYQLNPNISAEDFIFMIEGYNPEFK